MSTKKSNLIFSAFVALSAASPAFGQHSFLRTKTVDKSGNADHTTIQGAINACTQDGLKWTVLIYSDTYAENITLDGADENIDLVGVDRDGVIIVPSSGDGIVITSGTETSRNNSIRNLTIKTASGHGIKIVKGGTPAPANIRIEGVTIDANGTDKNGIDASEVEALRIANCKITTADGHGIEFIQPGGGLAPKDIVVEGVTIEADGTAKNGIEGIKAERVRIFACNVESDDRNGIRSGEEWTIENTSAQGSLSDISSAGFEVTGDATVITGCRGKGKRAGLKIDGADGVRVNSSFFHGGIGVDMALTAGKNVLLRDCYLLPVGKCRDG